jgi:hypothetical protein
LPWLPSKWAHYSRLNNSNPTAKDCELKRSFKLRMYRYAHREVFPLAPN